MSDFVHLHCHTEYSLLDGAIRLKDLCATAKDFGMSAAAITDHGNLHGAVTFYQTCKDFGLKPVIGCEVYVAKGDMRNKDARSSSDAGYHLVLLAQNNTGYRNLLKLVTEAHLYGFHYKPRVDKALLRDHAEGLVALSACLKGEVPYTLLREGMDAGLDRAREYAAMFPGRFYLELQANGIEEQFRVNELLVNVSEHLNLPLVATNDCHYLKKDDVEAHDVLLCIQTASQVNDERRMRFGTSELYYRAPEEMEREFAAYPEALANTARIAAEVDVSIDLKSHHFPVYETSGGRSLAEEFCDLAREGLKERLEKLPYRVDEKLYWDRLDYELGVICEMDFPGYFLIVQDFINWAKRERIPVGPGRGSAAGSIVAWALRITNLDPLPYNLLFERFLNVERVSMPDIDVDFCERRRLEVVKYVSDKYGGEDHVAMITTFGTMKAKAVVRDVGRALGMTYGETDKIAKLIPDDLKMTIKKALEKEPELKLLYDTDPQIQKLLDVSQRLEGLSRHASTHAAGVVISDKPMYEYVPLYRGKKGEVVTQFDMKRVEKVGLIKFDFLGLRTMTLIHDALDNIRLSGNPVPDLDTLPFDDEKTYQLYSRGDTDGVFQVESGGMRKYLTMLRPNCFEDVIAMLALYRPGPLGSGMVDEFIKRKHGQVPVIYPHPSLKELLSPTYGVIVYQEQVMSIARILAGYSLGEGDLLRRAMGKKNPEEMAKQRERFLSGSRENKVPDATANEIFDLMEKFAEYGFNKSHSAAYALISYHTAWLKTHYPREFMAALITSELENQDKILKYINACRDMNITVAGPDVNRSRWEFSVEPTGIRFGLGGIKNVGSEAIREIIEARDKDGPFPSLLDLCTRVNLRKVTKRVLESLIKAGALDGMGCTRAALMAGLERVAALAQKRQKDKDSGQVSMLAMLPAKDVCVPGLGLTCEEQALEEWDDDEKLRYEKESLGFYLSSHPLLAYRHEIKRLRLVSLDECAELGAGSEVRIAAIITDRKDKFTKNGDKMAICNIEDLTGWSELVVFPRAFEDMKTLLDAEEPLIFTCKVAEGEEQGEDAPRKVKLLAEKAHTIAAVQAASDEPVHLRGRRDCDLAALKAILDRHPGTSKVYLDLAIERAVCRLQLGSACCVTPSREFWREAEAWSKGASA